MATTCKTMRIRCPYDPDTEPHLRHRELNILARQKGVKVHIRRAGRVIYVSVKRPDAAAFLVAHSSTYQYWKRPNVYEIDLATLRRLKVLDNYFKRFTETPEQMFADCERELRKTTGKRKLVCMESFTPPLFDDTIED